jgi:hypothetical protein
MPEDYPLSVQNAISQWWRYWGFKENPFATSEADREYFLPFAFVDTGKLEWIYGNPKNTQTVLFFASRGCGKTAHRRKLESDACPARSNRDVLTVGYAEFSFWRNLSHKPMPEDHVEAIVGLAVEAILKTIAKLPKNKIDGLSDNFVEEFKHICNEYTKGILGQIRVDKSGISYLPEIKNIASKDSFSLFLSRLKQSSFPDYSLRDPSYHTTFKVLVEITQELGVQAIYVLIDAVDEVIIESSTWIDYLAPLISDLQLMRLPGLAFKFFLPAEKKKELFDRGFVRGDKLSYAELIWNEEDLRSLLENRLKAFNETGIDSLRMMCEPQLASQIDHLLIEKSKHIPRNLLQLGQHLVAVHCQRENKKRLLTIGDWDQVVKEAEDSHWLLKSDVDLTVLEISPTFVSVGGKSVDLSKLEYDFLWCLVQNDGTCDKDTIIQTIYDVIDKDGVSNNSLSSLIKRLREKLGDDPKNSRYISTVHGVGFRLLNWRKK